MPRERRVATLVAFAAHMQIEAQDDVLTLFDVVVGRLFGRCDRATSRERLRTLRELDAAALKLNQACQALLTFTGEETELRAAIFASVDREELERAAAVIQTLAQPPDDPHSFDNLLKRYKHVRQFLPRLLALVEFLGVDAEAPILAALRFVQEHAHRRNWNLSVVPMDGVPTSWRRRMCDGDAVDKRAYTMWLLDRVRHAMRHRNIFVAPSQRWADPRAQLLDGEAWRQAKSQVRRSLSHAANAEVAIPLLFAQLDEAYRRTSRNLPNNTVVQIIKEDGHDVLSLSPLESAEETKSAKALRKAVGDLLPRVDLPEVLLEVATWTGFCDEFTHVGDTHSRAASLDLSICAVLLAKACNIGLAPLVRPDHPALTYDRLGWVAQNYVRPDTLSRANARLVEYHEALPMTRFFGAGDVASADGMRFVVTPRTAHASPNSRYFGAGQGVTYYNYMSDQYAGLHALVVPGTLRDSLFVLDGLLECHHQTFELVKENWDDILRVTGSLLLGTVSASELMRTLKTGSGASKLTRAIAEIGRVGKTTHMLNVVDDPGHRRRIMVQLNRGENRHSLARDMFHGERGHIHHRYREGMEDQLGCLGLALNVVAVWNSRYMAQALEHLATNSGVRPDPQDLHHLSPLLHAHINMLGRYQFSIADPVAQGRLRDLNTDPGLWGQETADRLLSQSA
jgi:TnpA family transposase